MLIGALLAGSTVFSTVLSASVAELDTAASQNAVITIAEFSGKTRQEETFIASAAGVPTARSLRARALSARKERLATQSVAVRPKQKEPELLAVVDQPEITLTQRKIADGVLRQMPEKCRNTLQSFYVRYDHPEHRGLAGKNVMILDGSVPDDEFRALFVHEFGHIIDIGCFAGYSASGQSQYVDGKDPIYANDISTGFYQISWTTSTVQHSDAASDDFVSGYASYDVFEDFAESYAYFVLQNDAFKKRAETNVALKAKYEWILQNVFDGIVPTMATGKTDGNGNVPWDITKLPYTWNGTQKIALR